MQRLKINHITDYRFSNFVSLQPHQLLLRPREGHDLRIVSSRLEISPAHRIRWHRDVFDNSVGVVHFLEAANQLTIVSEVVIEHYEEAPLDFLVADYAVNYPFQYGVESRVNRTPFQSLVYPEDQWVVRDWLNRSGLPQGSMQTYGLLDSLNRAIANELTYIKREEPGVQSPSQTLANRSGSCRDHAALF